MPQTIYGGQTGTETLRAGSVLAVTLVVGTGATVFRSIGGAAFTGEPALTATTTYGPFENDQTFKVCPFAGATVTMDVSASPGAQPNDAQAAALAALVSADGNVTGSSGSIYDFLGPSQKRQGGMSMIDWSQCSIGAVTSGWNVTVDSATQYGGLPCLSVDTGGVAPAGGTTLTVTITLPSAIYLGGAKKVFFGVRPGNRSEAGDTTNYPQFWFNYSAGTTFRALLGAQASSMDGDWIIGGPYDQDASGSGYLTGTVDWAKVAGETVTSVRLVMTCAAGGISTPLKISPVFTDPYVAPTLSIFFDGHYSGQWTYARQIMAAYQMRASMSVIASWVGVQGGTMSAAQMDKLYFDDGWEAVHHTGNDAGPSGVGWDNTTKYPDGQEYAKVLADIQFGNSVRAARGWTRGMGYGVVGFTNGLSASQTLARRQNIARAVRDAGIVKLRQLGGYIGSHYEHAASPPLVTSTTLMVQTTAATPVATVTGVVDKLIARGGWTGLTYHDIVLTGETGNNRNVASFEADMDYIAGKVRAGDLRVLPFSEAMARCAGLPAPFRA